MDKATAKVVKSGGSQAIRIPKKYRFNTDEVFIEKRGESLILTPKPRSWDEYFADSRRFSDDFPDRIEDLLPEEREGL